MTSPNPNSLFLSQQIVQQTGSPPVLLPPRRSFHGQIIEAANHKATENRQTAVSSAQVWQWKIEVSLIPSLNMYYMIEPTSITLKQIPIRTVQSRMSDFLRLQSISYSYDAGSVRLDCIASSMLKFVVQFWRVGGGPNNLRFEDPNHAITIELQRRQGSVIELHSIRRKMFRALLTGDQTSSMDEERPRQLPVPDIIMSEIETGYDQDAGLADAIEIALRLLESQCLDQSKLGLESLGMLTESSVVSPRDALHVSRAIVLQEGKYGARLRTAISNFFGIAHQSNMEQGEDAVRYNLALALLANALQLVLDDCAANGKQSTIDPTDPFWGIVSQDLYYNVEKATVKPHEAAKSAKCIRLLNDMKSRGAAATLTPRAPTIVIQHAGIRSCLAQAHQYGRHCHLSLERESQKLLAVDSFARTH